MEAMTMTILLPKSKTTTRIRLWLELHAERNRIIALHLHRGLLSPNQNRWTDKLMKKMFLSAKKKKKNGFIEISFPIGQIGCVRDQRVQNRTIMIHVRAAVMGSMGKSGVRRNFQTLRAKKHSDIVMDAWELWCQDRRWAMIKPWKEAL